MAKKAPAPKKAKKELTAPFFMLTYGDMMTLLLCFFVLLFAMSTVEVSKFQAQVSVMQGSLGISRLYQHAPMQQNLPAPSIKVSTRTLSRVMVSPTETDSTAEFMSHTHTPRTERNEEVAGKLRTLGFEHDMEIRTDPNEVVIVLPTYGIFEKGAYTIDAESPEVRRVKRFYVGLAEQITALTAYDVVFVGHTDTTPIEKKRTENGPRSNTELGFLRALAMYDFFFKDYLQDKTRIVFASQGDNIPIIPNATLDSELRKNRRVEIHLKRVEEK